MNNYPEGANEDKNAPWHEKEPQKIMCPECGGHGSFIGLSDCCAEPIIHGDLCSNCREHCGALVCEDCNGTGKITAPEEEPDPDMSRDEIEG